MKSNYNRKEVVKNKENIEKVEHVENYRSTSSHPAAVRIMCWTLALVMCFSIVGAIVLNLTMV